MDASYRVSKIIRSVPDSSLIDTVTSLARQTDPSHRGESR